MGNAAPEAKKPSPNKRRVFKEEVVIAPQTFKRGMTNDRTVKKIGIKTILNRKYARINFRFQQPQGPASQDENIAKGGGGGGLK